MTGASEKELSRPELILRGAFVLLTQESEGDPYGAAIVLRERRRQQGLTWLCGTSALPYRCCSSLSSQPTASHYSKKYYTETHPLPSAPTEPHPSKLLVGRIH